MARIQVPKKGTFTCDSSTAEEAVAYLRQVLDEPAHGNVLLSCGPQKLDPKQQLREFNADFVFANYSWLSSGPPIHIAATELRGITIEQLSFLLDFIVDIACSWCDAHHLAYGQPLSFEAFNLYHADFWVIGPATAGHGLGGCSYVELVATSAQMQRPLWPDQRIIERISCYRNDNRDKGEVLRIITDYGWAIRYAPPLFRNSEEVCVAAMKTYGLGLEFLSPAMRENEKVVKAAVSHCGMALIFAPAEFRNRRDIVKQAVQNAGLALEFAHPDLKKDQSIVYYAMQKDARALQCADESLKSNRTFLLKALANCPQALDFVDISVRFDPELVKIALGQEYRPVSPKERPSSPKPAAPPKPRSRRSRRALLLDERRRRLSRSPDTKSARDPVKHAVPVENSLEPTTTIPEQ